MTDDSVRLTLCVSESSAVSECRGSARPASPIRNKSLFDLSGGSSSIRRCGVHPDHRRELSANVAHANRLPRYGDFTREATLIRKTFLFAVKRSCSREQRNAERRAK